MTNEPTQLTKEDLYNTPRYLEFIANTSPYSHIIDSRQFNEKFIYEIIAKTEEMKSNLHSYENDLNRKILATDFYQPSTRTRFSFEAAIIKLGGSVISTENAEQFSSVAKGETLEDSIRYISCLADFIVLRNRWNDSSFRAANVSRVPVLNGGAGTAQHPTQALLDVFTIYENFGRLTNLDIGVFNDLKNSRTVQSLVHLLSDFPGNRFYFCSIPSLMLPAELEEDLSKKGVQYLKTNDLREALSKSSVAYFTRLQAEYIKDEVERKRLMEEIAENENKYCKYAITEDTIKFMPENSILLHPLPRGPEIDPRVDLDPRAKYFEQAENGLYVRMAILKILNRRNRKKP